MTRMAITHLLQVFTWPILSSNCWGLCHTDSFQMAFGSDIAGWVLLNAHLISCLVVKGRLKQHDSPPMTMTIYWTPCPSSHPQCLRMQQAEIGSCFQSLDWLGSLAWLLGIHFVGWIQLISSGGQVFLWLEQETNTAKTLLLPECHFLRLGPGRLGDVTGQPL